MNQVDKTGIEKALADKDGSLRDINIGNLGAEEIINFLEWYSKNYKVLEATNSKGEDVGSLLPKDIFKSGDRPFYFKLRGADQKDVLVSNLNVFISEEPEDVYEIELNFAPARYSYESFVKFLTSILDCTEKREYYVKYENVSWVYGDDSGQDIIFSYKNLPL